MARKPIKFFPLTDELRNLLKLIKSIGGEYPHQSLVDFTLKSGHYHHKDKVWLNVVRQYYINTSIKIT
jgi:hypothetical protein